MKLLFCVVFSSLFLNSIRAQEYIVSDNMLSVYYTIQKNEGDSALINIIVKDMTTYPIYLHNEVGLYGLGLWGSCLPYLPSLKKEYLLLQFNKGDTIKKILLWHNLKKTFSFQVDYYKANEKAFKADSIYLNYREYEKQEKTLEFIILHDTIQ